MWVSPAGDAGSLPVTDVPPGVGGIFTFCSRCRRAGVGVQARESRSRLGLRFGAQAPGVR